MLNNKTKLSWHCLEGTPAEIGYQLGCYGRRAVEGPLMKTQLWKEVTSVRYRPRVQQFMVATRKYFPDQWHELRGLSEGLGLPFEDVFAWNCRGDLLIDTADGCTTVMLPGSDMILAHNEDGLPCLNGYCFIAEVSPTAGRSFFSFCYPGSIPGHTFVYFSDGRVMTVNNLRLKGSGSEIPRMVLARALLNCKNIPDMLELINKKPPCGGFHLSLFDLENQRLISIEMGAGFAQQKILTEPEVHANHALFHPSLELQLITQSSCDRQQRGEQLLAAGCRDPLTILRDQWVEGLPIYRADPDDPDNENTLATFVAKLEKQGIYWSIYSGKDGEPAYTSE